LRVELWSRRWRQALNEYQPSSQRMLAHSESLGVLKGIVQFSRFLHAQELHDNDLFRCPVTLDAVHKGPAQSTFVLGPHDERVRKSQFWFFRRR